MREASMKDITKFLECNRIAAVGVSRDRRHFSRIVLNQFLAAGYDMAPVNPRTQEIDGLRCFHDVSEINPPVQGALLLTGSPEATNQAVNACQQAGIRKIWIYKNVHDRRNHEQAVEFCRAQKFAVIEGYCPLMFLPRAGFVHRAHKFFMKVAGNYPL